MSTESYKLLEKHAKPHFQLLKKPLRKIIVKFHIYDLIYDLIYDPIYDLSVTTLL